MSLHEYIKRLQHRPYEERVRILWLASLVCAVSLVAVWIAVGKLGPTSAPAENDLLQSLKAGVEDAGRGYADLKQQITAPPAGEAILGGQKVVTLKNFSVDEKLGRLTVTVQVNNPTREILNFLNAQTANIYLVDGDRRLPVIGLYTASNEPFPQRILSGNALEGRFTFAQPAASQIKLEFTGLSFESQPNAQFSEILELDLAQVKGLQDTLLPRQ